MEGVFACTMKAGSDPTAWSYSPSPVLYQSCLNSVFPLPFLSFQVSKCPRNTITGPWQLLSWLPKGFFIRQCRVAGLQSTCKLRWHWIPKTQRTQKHKGQGWDIAVSISGFPVSHGTAVPGIPPLHRISGLDLQHVLPAVTVPRSS